MELLKKSIVTTLTIVFIVASYEQFRDAANLAHILPWIAEVFIASTGWLAFVQPRKQVYIIDKFGNLEDYMETDDEDDGGRDI